MKQLTKISIDRFPGLDGFEITLSKLNVIVGLNGTCKTRFLQFVDFLAYAAVQEQDAWCADHSSVFQTAQKDFAAFSVTIRQDDGEEIKYNHEGFCFDGVVAWEGWPSMKVVDLSRPALNAQGYDKLSDGQARVKAVSDAFFQPYDVLGFDDPDLHVDTELYDDYVSWFEKSEKQLIVTTHSPLFLNYLDDAVAKESMHYFYRTPQGNIRTVPFFSMPYVEQKLSCMGPGEAFIDTNLKHLNEDIEEAALR